MNLVRGEARPEILRLLARQYLDAGFIEKAKFYFNQAYTIDKNESSYLNSLGYIEYCQENFEASLSLWKHSKEIDSSSLIEMNYYFVIPGHVEEAYLLALRDQENFRKSGELNLIRSHRIGYAFWMAGKREEGLKYFNQQIMYSMESIKLNRVIAQRKAAYYDLAATFAFLGNKEEAYRYLDEFAKRNTFQLGMVTLLKHDLLFESIRNEPRFKDIVMIVESKYLAEHERVRQWIELQMIE